MFVQVQKHPDRLLDSDDPGPHSTILLAKLLTESAPQIDIQLAHFAFFGGDEGCFCSNCFFFARHYGKSSVYYRPISTRFCELIGKCTSYSYTKQTESTQNSVPIPSRLLQSPQRCPRDWGINNNHHMKKIRPGKNHVCSCCSMLVYANRWNESKVKTTNSNHYRRKRT